MTVELRKLSIEDGNDIYDMLQEIPKEENGFEHGANGKTFEEFQKWLLRNDEISKGVALEHWMVPQNIYWLYIDGFPVGMGKLRHCLTDKLKESGGHIGYSVRPSQRNKGYGTLLMRLLSERAKEIGIDRLLITVRNDNAASIKVAVNAGGKIEKIDNERHFIWIDLMVL